MLPIVNLFERHWEESSKFVLKQMLSPLRSMGYATLCVEAPQSFSSDRIVTLLEENLAQSSTISSQAKEYLSTPKAKALLATMSITVPSDLSAMSFQPLTRLIQCFVSSTQYVDVTEKIKQLPAHQRLAEVCKEATALSVQMKGIDIDDLNTAVTAISLTERHTAVARHENRRIRTMLRNIGELRRNNHGIIFLCGASHAHNLSTGYGRRGWAKSVVFSFPYSPRNYDNAYNDLPDLCSAEPLASAAALVSSPTEVKQLADRIVQEVRDTIFRDMNPFLKRNSHANALSVVFSVEVRGTVRPGHHLDLFIDSSLPTIQMIRETLATNEIATQEISFGGQAYLSIPNANTAEVAEKIHLLSEFRETALESAGRFLERGECR